MRALLVANPHATTTTAAGRDVIARAMAGEVKLDVLRPSAAGTPPRPPAQAVRDGVELVVAHGGDGTLNEVVNGVLAASDGRPGDPLDGPVVGIVPGGSANVFARALGVPVDPMAATARLLEQVAAGRAGWSASATRSPAGARPAGGSRSTRAWAGTPRSWRPSSAPGPRAGRPRRCATPPPPCASTSANAAGRTR